MRKVGEPKSHSKQNRRLGRKRSVRTASGNPQGDHIVMLDDGSTFKPIGGSQHSCIAVVHVCQDLEILTGRRPDNPYLCWTIICGDDGYIICDSYQRAINVLTGNPLTMMEVTK